MASVIFGGAALNQTPLDWTGNVQRIRTAWDRARDRQIEILCLPELCLTGYGCEDLFLANWFVNRAWKHFLQLIPESKGLVTTVGLPIAIEGHLYNGCALLIDGELKGITCKQILANHGVHYEQRWFSPWPRGKAVTIKQDGLDLQAGDLTYECQGLCTGIEICEDAWAGQNRPAYDFQQRGVELILNPSASHFAFGKTQIREELVLEGSRIIDGIYVYSNLLGNEAGKMIYDGEIMLAQEGEMRQLNDRLSFQDVNVAKLRMDTKDSSQTEVVDMTQYADDKETEFHEAVTLGLFDYLRKSKSRGYVLSLSGGADSSSLAIMVATMVQRGLEELGLRGFCEKLSFFAEEEIAELEKEPKQATQQKALLNRLLITAYQASRHSSEATFESAKELAESLGATFYHWSIDEEVDSYTRKMEEAIGRKLNWEQDDITLQNIQARARAPIIWMLANTYNYLLLATSNRSEADVGYATMDGDTSGSISPITGVDKHFILSYLRYAEKELGYTGLRYVNSLQPTAELRPESMAQTDEGDLMPYPVIAAIERKAIQERLSPLQVYQSLQGQGLEEESQLKKHVALFFRMWARNQWKRERYAPAFHLDAFSVDPRAWCRFPILSGAYASELEELEEEAG